MANGKWLLLTLALVSSVGCSNEQTCDYTTGTITTCSYRSGMCPCDQVEECGAP